jgi:HlyD family type I secretion membrane fusion protein
MKAFTNIFKSRHHAAGLSSEVRSWQFYGWGLVILFVAGSFVWAANASLDGAAIAKGVVRVESNRKDIQHLEGGIVKEILVKDGDKVEVGQVLAYLDDTKAQATLDLLSRQYYSAMALRARLQAEQANTSKIDFPQELHARSHEPKFLKILYAQRDALKSRQDYVRNQENVLKQRLERVRRESKGHAGQVLAKTGQLNLLEEEIAPLEKLFEDGLVVKSKILGLKRRAADMQGEIAEYKAKIETGNRSIAEIQNQLALPSGRRANEVAKELQREQSRIGDLQERIRAARDVVDRTLVVAPQNGTIVDLKVHTVGGVIQPGEVLMSLVPSGDKLVIDAKINPRDRDVIYRGMKARVRLTAFSPRHVKPMQGIVTAISADQLIDPATGVAYFKARIVPSVEIAGPAHKVMAKLMPGMQAEVFLQTGERTVLDYLLEPVWRSFDHAGREL